MERPFSGDICGEGNKLGDSEAFWGGEVGDWLLIDIESTW